MAGLKETVCFIIHGRVQGVFYRDSTRKVARDLGIKGSAVNRSDGSVQVIAKGTPEVLKELKAWLRQGPEMALVENVEEVDIENQLEFNDFIIG
ncbi:uncharacterized protein METZ01_LOCUS159340 [marine metagenome]|jgi:acylphosphatase|uniref:Acylphosphatase-like domain-containing protein n=1 Tax=marine metagenome TaxID=408172 RepID=A0A382AY56_9ZZZZ|tara:strand:+ start:111 stop:392 length:282 start_codon:yes stop_codon:yes gene_type:complete